MQKYTKKVELQNSVDTKTQTEQIPFTRLISYHEFNKERRTSIIEYLPLLLSYFKDGLTCREISDITGIWVQCLTNPLQSLVKCGRIEIIGVKRCLMTNRLNLVYSAKGQSHE